jgi:hypothetical protein
VLTSVLSLLGSVQAQVQSVTIGETAVLSTGDSGHSGDALLRQRRNDGPWLLWRDSPELVLPDFEASFFRNADVAVGRSNDQGHLHVASEVLF